MAGSDSEWTDMVVGDRMAVDREFRDRIEQSRFSRQEWGLIMTATEFRIEHPDDADRARIVADTSKVETVVPEFEQLREAQAMGASGGVGRPSPGGGIVSTIKDALGLGGGGGGDVDEEQLAAADELAQAYAAELQTRLEEQGRWDEVRTAAVDR